MVKTNTDKGYNILAILALIFAFLFPPAGIILGIIALVQIKKTGEKGKWMAWVPIIFTILFFLFIFIGILAYFR